MDVIKGRNWTTALPCKFFHVTVKVSHRGAHSDGGQLLIVNDVNFNMRCVLCSVGWWSAVVIIGRYEQMGDFAVITDQ